jgi:hypothetical protein
MFFFVFGVDFLIFTEHDSILERIKKIRENEQKALYEKRQRSFIFKVRQELQHFKQEKRLSAIDWYSQNPRSFSSIPLC